MSQPNAQLDALPHLPIPLVSIGGIGPTGPPITNAATKRRFILQYGSHPLDLFTPAVHAGTIPAARWIYTDNEFKPSLLVFTDGSALDNGQPNVRAGYGVVFSPLQSGLCMPLERSPLGYELTSNRAELRAVIGALTMRYWPGEGFYRIVIATDSEYVVRGATEWVNGWETNGWQTASGNPVKNQDLWSLLLDKLQRWEARGFSVQFLHIRREWNTVADACAKDGALSDDVPDDYEELVMIGD